MFGLDENHKIRSSFSFPANNLYITSVDIQSVEPVDQRTRDALMKSVQLAIEITTNSQEATARFVLYNKLSRLIVESDWIESTKYLKFSLGSLVSSKPITDYLYRWK